jgi:hypothetical protein
MEAKQNSWGPGTVSGIEAKFDSTSGKTIITWPASLDPKLTSYSIYIAVNDSSAFEQQATIEKSKTLFSARALPFGNSIPWTKGYVYFSYYTWLNPKRIDVAIGIFPSIAHGCLQPIKKEKCVISSFTIGVRSRSGRWTKMDLKPPCP